MNYDTISIKTEIVNQLVKIWKNSNDEEIPIAITDFRWDYLLSNIDQLTDSIAIYFNLKFIDNQQILYIQQGKQCSWKFSINLNTLKYKVIESNLESNNERTIINLGCYYKDVYYAMQYYFTHKPTIFNVTSFKEERIKHIKGKNNKIKAKHITKIVRKITIDLNEYNKMPKPKIYTCPCWSVMGYWRRTKNGNMVWVRPFLKGKNRNDPDKKVEKNYKSF